MRLLQKAGDNRALFGNSFLIFLIRFFPSLATLLVVIFLSRNVSETLYGSYQDFWVQLLLIAAVGTMGIPAFVITYTPQFASRLLRSMQLKHYIGIVLCMLTAALVFVYVRHADGMVSLFVPGLFFIVYVLNAIAESLLVVLRRFSLLLWINLLYSVVFVWLHKGLVDEIYGLETLFAWLLLPGIIKLLFTAVLTISAFGQIVPATEQEYSRADVRSLWLHIGIYDVLQRIFSWIDKFAISLIFAASVSAIYFNGTFDVPFLPLLLGAVSSAALLQLSSSKDRSDNKVAIQVANTTARMLSAVVFPVFFFLFLFRSELFNVLLTDKYAASIPIFAVTVLIVPLRAYNFTSILQNRHKGSIINIGAVLDLLMACALMYPLYQLAGLPGLAASFVISSYFQGAYYLWHTARLLNVPVLQLLPLKNWLIKLIVFATLFIAIHYLLDILFAPLFVLTLGALMLAIIIGITLVLEFRASK